LTAEATASHPNVQQLPNHGTGTPRDVVAEVRDRLNQAYTHDRQNREEAIEDLRFLSGDQWPEYARTARADRPMLTINKLPQFLHQVTNDIRQNAAVIKVTPVDGKQDPDLAAVYDGIVNDIQYRSSAKHIYSTAAYHAAACGIGHWRVVSKYCDDDTFDQELGLELIPYPLAVFWDPASVKPDRSDAIWCIVVDMVPRETFRLKYPDKTPDSVSDLRVGGDTTGIHWQTTDYVLIAEYWAKVPTKRTLAGFQDGTMMDISSLNMAQLAELQMTHGQIMQKRVRPGYAVEQSMVTGSQMISGPHKWPGKYIPIIPVVGTEVPLERTTIRSGLIRHAKEAQQLYNFYRSAAAESIALAPKAPFLATAKQIGKYKSQWDNANKQNRPYLIYEPDREASMPAPQRVAAPEPPQALWHEAQVATDDIKATTGIYDASLGAKSNETSGVAIKRREQQGDTANFHYQDNLQRSIEQCGRVIVDLIPKIYDNQRVVRLFGADGKEQFVKINHALITQDGEPALVNDLSVGRYDVRVTIGPSHQTKRLETAQAITELMAKLPPEIGMVLADIAVRNMDIPDAEEAATRISRMLPPQAMQDPNTPPPNPLDDPMARAELSTKYASARKTMADANKVAAETAMMFGVPVMPPPLPPDVEPQPASLQPPMDVPQGPSMDESQQSTPAPQELAAPPAPV
jgi:hypothetical protein